jgi:thiol:disulfide interchange protein
MRIKVKQLAKTMFFARHWLAPALVCLVAVLAFGLLGGPARGQDGFDAGSDVFPDFSLNGFGADEPEPIEWTARYFVEAAGSGRLEVAATLAPSWHIYATTQKPGGPTRTRIAVTGPAGVKASGPFEPDSPPSTSVSAVYDGLTVEEHDGTVTWSAPIALPPGFDGAVTVAVDALICKSGGDNRCMPVQETLSAESGGSLGSSLVGAEDGGDASAIQLAAESVAKPFRDGDYVVQWKAVVAPKEIAAGESGVLQFTATPDPTFHVYQSATDDSESSTNFVVTRKDGLRVGAPVASQPVVTKSIVPSQPPISYYKGKVTWQLPIQVPADAAAGEKWIEGMIAYQACTETSCHRPVALKFTAKLTVGGATRDEPAPIALESGKLSTALDAAAMTMWVDPIEPADVPRGRGADDDDDLAAAPVPTREDADVAASPVVIVPSTTTLAFPVVLLFAFLGGVILNVMPCVLPVVGLKIMGFVSQAGQDRRRILVLNLAYCAGIFVVFALLAMLAIVFNFGWGQQFQYFSVRLGVTVGLFAFALSYFNIWEIPVPGMAAGKTSQQLQRREGLSGAFSKGVFATLLATPCSGPLLGGVFGATIGLPNVLVGLIFMTMALGMSTPYLLIGMRPQWIRWLPKPGAWMETFKQFMAFFFLGAVAYFFYQFSDENKVPVFVTLIGVWFGCWIIGLVPSWDTLQKRLVAWVGGVSMATAIGIGAFTILKAESQLQWVDYSEAGFQRYQAQGKTVLVDFSAKWCVNCLVNLETAIDTDATRQLIDELDVVAMYADWTNYDPEVTRKLEELNSKSIPVLAIYPAGRPREPIVLRDLVTQSSVLSALRSAGPSLQPAASSGDERSRSLASSNR